MGVRDGDLDPPKKVPVPPISILAQFNPPADSGLKQVLWRISLPLIYLFYYTVPDCRIEQWRSWYVVTFTMAMVWIALFSYVMVWMITVVGIYSSIITLPLNHETTNNFLFYLTHSILYIHPLKLLSFCRIED